MAEGISLDQLRSAVSTLAAPQSGISLDQLRSAATSKPTEAAPASSPSGGFLSDTAATLKEAALAGGKTILEKGSVEEVKREVGGAVGAVKALAAGARDLGELMVLGVSSLAGAAVTESQADKPSVQGFVDEFTKEHEYNQRLFQKGHELTSAITKVNLAPEGHEEEMMAKLLGIIPEGINAAGDTMAEKFGAAAGAMTQGLLSLLLFTPELAAKSLGSIRKIGAKPEFSAEFEARMAKSKEEAYDYAEKVVGPKDPELAERMKQQALSQPGVFPGEKPETPVSPKSGAVAGEKVAAAFTALAVEKKEAAEAIAEHIRKADPKLAAKLDGLVKDAGKATGKELDKLAKETIEGRDAKPSAVAAPPVSPVVEAYLDYHSNYSTFTKMGEAIAPAIEAKIQASLAKDPFGSGEALFTSHELLDLMHDNTGNSFFKGMIRKVRDTVDDFAMYGAREVTNPDTGAQVAGYYDPKDHSGAFEHNPGNPKWTPVTILHEILHGGTTKFLYENPEHRITKDLTRLWNIANRRAKKMGLSDSEISKINGLKDVHEFVSEAMTSAPFQKFLLDSEQYKLAGEKVRAVVEEFARLIQSLYKITDPQQAQLLHTAVFHTYEALEAQKGLRETGELGQGGELRTAMPKRPEDESSVIPFPKAKVGPDKISRTTTVRSFAELLKDEKWLEESAGRKFEKEMSSIGVPLSTVGRLETSIVERNGKFDVRLAKENIDSIAKTFGTRSEAEAFAKDLRQKELEKHVAEIRKYSTPEKYAEEIEGIARILVKKGKRADAEKVLRAADERLELLRDTRLRELEDKHKELSRQIADKQKAPVIPIRSKVVEAPKIEAGIRSTSKEINDEAVRWISPREPFAPLLQTQAGKFAEKKLSIYLQQAMRNFSPESLGKHAKEAGAIIAKAVAEEAQKTSQYFHQAKLRRDYWQAHEAEAADFIRRFESGEEFTNPTLAKAAKAYRDWNNAIALQDARLGLKYDPRDNYLAHIFKDGKAVEDYFTNKYGSKWGDPSFTKKRTFDLYEEAVKAGYTPKYTNPEDIMLARQHASDVAQMQVQVLNDLASYGIATKIVKTRMADGKVKSTPQPEKSQFWRSPTGERYWVHDEAYAVMDNAFKSKSLWQVEGIGGDVYRGTMYLKNFLVPIKLMASLFHPLHVVGIDSAAAMMRSSKGLLTGNVNPVAWMRDMVKSGLLYEALPVVGEHSRTGNRLLDVWQGKVDGASLTAADKQALSYMVDGGFIPEMSSQYRTKAWQNLTDAVRAKKASAAFHVIPGMIDLVQKPVFERWIPGLKIASYLKDVDMALKADPTLATDALKRQQTFRRLAKSVDNRYGEMAYNTLFWNRWVKDLAVGSTLSLGWNLGFLREYGGGALDIVKGLGGEAKVAKGDLDRPMFVLAYTTAALAYGGLMTYAFTGKPPTGLLDYVYPKTGEKTPDGKDKRVSTMFYTREFGSIYFHSRNEGIASGIAKTIESKASPLFEMMRAWATNTTSFGQNISNPDDPAFQRLEQKLAWTLRDIEPISAPALTATGKAQVLTPLGFSPAPKYATESAIEGDVTTRYNKFVKPAETPFEKAELSADSRRLRELYESDRPKDAAEYDKLLDQMADKYDLTDEEIKRIESNFEKGVEPHLTKFARLPWTEQKKILDKHWYEMTEDEQDDYLAHSNKTHLRDNYEPPERK